MIDMKVCKLQMCTSTYAYKILGQNPPGHNPPDKTPRAPHPHKTPYRTPRTQTTTAKPPRKNPRSPTKHPEDKTPGKIQGGVHFKFRWLQSSIINMMNGKLYVYIQLQMRYLIASGST